MRARPKIVQIEAIYQEFAKSLYLKWPSLSSLNFETQITTILDSGWSWGQNIVPALNPAQWERYYIIPRLFPAQIAWAREMNIPKERWNLREILIEQLRCIDPEVIYLSDVVSFDFSILDDLRRTPLIVVWLASRLPPSIPWDRIDVLLSGIGAIRDETLKRGVRSAYNFNSAAPCFRYLNSGSNRSEAVRNQIGFSGSFLRGLHDERAEMLAKLSSTLPGISVNVYTAQPFRLPADCPLKFSPPVFASDVIKTYTTHELIVDARADFGLREIRFNRDTSNMRIFEATRAGSLLLTEYAPNLENMFEIGKEIICYRSFEELADLASYYCKESNDSTRRNVAIAGYTRTLSSHTIELRANEFDAIVKRSM